MNAFIEISGIFLELSVTIEGVGGFLIFFDDFFVSDFLLMVLFLF